MFWTTGKNVVRTAMAVALTGLLVACSTGSDTVGNSQTLDLLKATVTRNKAPAPTATRDQLRAAITPEFRAQSGNVPLLLVSSLRVPVSSILSRASVNQNVETYITPDQITFALRDGILIASRGLGYDLMAADVSGVSERIRAGSGTAVRTHKYLDGKNQLVPYRFDCSYARAGAEVVESCSGEGLSFTNKYTLGAGGRIAVSTQWVSPGLQSYLIEHIR
ncbi:YjbF family lipoprotein [Pseudooceanicola sp. MF1-13]|uniref:YjbF family lipoprotein n=1 Tax=Pseudooceanicola sp. MF1-13 TaxID=3379095 RepID=UPI003892121F